MFKFVNYNTNIIKMINDYNLEYTDIIQYLNQIVIKKSERLNIVFKAKELDNSDYNI